MGFILWLATSPNRDNICPNDIQAKEVQKTKESSLIAFTMARFPGCSMSGGAHEPPTLVNRAKNPDSPETQELMKSEKIKNKTKQNRVDLQRLVGMCQVVQRSSPGLDFSCRVRVSQSGLSHWTRRMMAPITNMCVRYGSRREELGSCLIGEG